MDAHEKGFGLVIPTPSYSGSQLGNIVYIDDGGDCQAVGNIFEDEYFKILNQDEDRITIEEERLSTTAAFTTGCMNVKPLSEAEYSMYVY